ncbi:MAG: hypothetical protein ACKV2T_40360 [Kofleriaceae bacterium]
MAVSLLSRLWSSPTAMMLASTGLQSLLAVLIVPIVLYRFAAPTVALWALFSSLTALVNVATQSFTVTFVRAVAYSHAGASSLDDLAAGRSRPEARESNRELLAEVVSGARIAFLAIAVCALVLLASLGTVLVDHLVAATPDPRSAWIAWGLVLAASTSGVYTNLYVGYVEGHDHVAVVRRWDAIFALFAGVSSCAVLLLGGDFLALVISTQGWLLVRAVRNWMLCRRIDDRAYTKLARRPWRPALQTLWPAAWRSFVGVAGILGVNYMGGIFYAQIGEPRLVAGYLLAIRLFDALSSVARAPFYSRIPLLVRLHAQGQTSAQLATARSGMRLAYWIFVVGMLAAAALGPSVFRAIGSDVPFPALQLWLGLGTAYLLERYGAMHLQLFSTTNMIVWHTAALGYALIYLVTLAALHGPIDVYAFPIAMGLGYAGWYSWFSARHSYRAFGIRFWSFERALFVPPLVVATTATVIAASVG